MRRLQVVLGHLKAGLLGPGGEPGCPGVEAARGGLPQRMSWWCNGRRTAIGRSGRGGFKVKNLVSSQVQMEVGWSASVRFLGRWWLRPIWDRSVPLREGEALGAGIRTRDPKVALSAVGHHPRRASPPS